MTSIGHLERGGDVAEVAAGANFGLIVGPDGYLWFTEADRICRLLERVGRK